MTLLFDGKRLLFEERGGCICHTLTLHLPFDGILLLNGTTRFASKNKVIRIPIRHFKEGDNSMLFRTDCHAYPVEGLRRAGETLRPTGLSHEETIVSLLTRLTALEEVMRELAERVERQEHTLLLFS